MSKNITALESAKAAHATTTGKLQSAKDALDLQISAAHNAVAKLRRTENSIMDGDATVARELGEARLEAETATNTIDFFKKAVVKHERLEQEARLGVIVESVKADAGDLLNDAKLQELEAEAREDIDQILFSLADAVSAHNKSYAASRQDITEAQKGLAPNTGALVTRDMLMVDGLTFRELAPISVLKGVVGHPAIRWNDTRNADAIAASKAEIEAKRAEATERQNADRVMMRSLDDKSYGGKVKPTSRVK